MRFSRRVQVSALSISVLIGLMPGVAISQVDSKFPVRAEALINDYVDGELFSGTVLVAKNGKPVFRKVFGAANREWAMPNAAGTKFRIGSLTKQFTAAAILRLVDENKLRLDDPLVKYLPGNPASWEKVTIRELLGHTSGIPSYTMYKDFGEKLMPVEHTPEQLIDLVKDAPLEFCVWH